MNELVRVLQNDLFTDSLVIAEGTGVGHRKIKNVIKKYVAELEKFGKLSAPYQAESTGGRPEEYYRLNEQQATFLITLLKNTEVVVQFKARLVEQFYVMRQMLIQRQSPLWQNIRCLSKEIRKKETDIIKEFVTYATSHGSTHANRYYTSFSKLADKAAGIKEGCRDSASLENLNRLMLVEQVIAGFVQDGIVQRMPYKQLYTGCRERLEQVLGLVYLNKGTDTLQTNRE